MRFLDEAELEALLRHVPSDGFGQVEAPLYVTAAMTGLRMGELLGLALGGHRLDSAACPSSAAFVRGEFTTPKSARGSRSVPLAARVATELDALSKRTAYAADADLVFGHPLLGKPLDRSKVLKRFKAALVAAEVREVRFHDLRHTFGTRMAASGVPMRTLQEWLGHRDFATTLIYADYQPSTREAALIDDASAELRSWRRGRVTPPRCVRTACRGRGIERPVTKALPLHMASRRSVARDLRCEPGTVPSPHALTYAFFKAPRGMGEPVRPASRRSVGGF